MPRYASLEKDLLVMLKEFFEVQFFSWLTIWAVKWNLLFMFKRVTDGLSPTRRVLWVMVEKENGRGNMIWRL
jgi:hypothetical protein